MKNNTQKQPDNTAKIHAISHDGRGIATIENKTTFISGALPQETVTYRITNRRGSFNEAICLDFEGQSADRATPPCQHFGLCGGCSLQHISMAAQTRIREEALIDQLKRLGNVTPETILPPLTAGETGYRRKARLGAKFVIKKDKMLVGFREKKSRYLADLDSCQVLHPRVGLQLEALKALVGSLSIYQQVPQIEVALGDDDLALIVRHMQPLTEDDKNKLIDFGKKHQADMYLQPNPPAQIEKLWPPASAHRLQYTLPEFNLTFHFHPTDFTQVNLEMNRLMVSQAMRLLDPKDDESILDLYCGIGNFTLPISLSACSVTGIEGSEEMVQRGYENAELNNRENVKFFAANLEKPPMHTDWMSKQYDKVLLDPPRVGAQPMLAPIAQTGAKCIVYVSCNPATLARDAGELVHQHGYHLQKAGIMNMFPHTAHAEAMAVFIKKDKD